MTPDRNSNKIRNSKGNCSTTVCIRHAQEKKQQKYSNKENAPPVSLNLLPAKMILSDCVSSKIAAESAQRTMLGIRIMWVHTDYRRSKVAHNMLDIIRRSFFYGRVLSVDEVSFSEPTDDGYRFASFYCNRTSIWTY